MSLFLLLLGGRNVSYGAPAGHSPGDGEKFRWSEASGLPETVSSPPPVGHYGFLLRTSLDVGGDKLVDVTWSDGTTATLRAGQLITFSAVFTYYAAGPWALEAAFGMKFDRVNGSNGKIEFRRYPLDVLGFWTIGNHRLGGGAIVHFAPTFKCAASGLCDDTVSFNTALGGTLQYGYRLRTRLNFGFDIGVRYSLIRYSASGFPTKDGSGVGGFAGIGWM